MEVLCLICPQARHSRKTHANLCGAELPPSCRRVACCSFGMQGIHASAFNRLPTLALVLANAFSRCGGGASGTHDAHARRHSSTPLSVRVVGWLGIKAEQSSRVHHFMRGKYMYTPRCGWELMWIWLFLMLVGMGKNVWVSVFGSPKPKNKRTPPTFAKIHSPVRHMAVSVRVFF